jgi:hypothetical protein
MSDLVEIFVTEIAEEVTLNVTPNLIEVNVIKGVVPTNPITGIGTTNFLPKFTGGSTIGNSLIFDNGTSVGIGTTSPTSSNWSRTLQLEGASAGFKVASSSANGEFWAAGDVGINVNTSGKNLYLGNASSLTAFTLASSGNVGIGTTSPSTLLHLFKTSFPVLTLGSGTVTGNLGIDTANNFLNLGTETNHALVFTTNNTERLRITPSGNVGIGTTSPTQRLDVNGLINSTNGISVGGEGVSRFWTGTQAAYDAITTKVSTTVYLIT